MTDCVKLKDDDTIYVVTWWLGGSPHSFYRDKHEAMAASSFLSEDGVQTTLLEVKAGYLDVKTISRRYYKSRYEGIREYWQSIGSDVIPPPWDELTEEQQNTIIEQEKNYQKEMNDFGNQLAKEHGPKEA